MTYLFRQMAGPEDKPELVRVIKEKRQGWRGTLMNSSKWAYKMQVAVLSQMQLQVMEGIEAQERELRRLSAKFEQSQKVLHQLPTYPR